MIVANHSDGRKRIRQAIESAFSLSEEHKGPIAPDALKERKWLLVALAKDRYGLVRRLIDEYTEVENHEDEGIWCVHYNLLQDAEVLDTRRQ